MYAEFDLTFDRQELERIYFSKLRSNLLLSPITRKPFIGLIFMSVCTLVLMIAFWLMKEPVVLVLAVGFALGLLAALVDYFRKLKLQAKRNGEIRSYLQYLDSIEKHRLIVKDEGIVLQQDGEESAAGWESFSKVSKRKDHLKLSGEIDFVIPTSGLSQEEFGELRGMLETMVQK